MGIPKGVEVGDPLSGTLNACRYHERKSVSDAGIRFLQLVFQQRRRPIGWRGRCILVQRDLPRSFQAVPAGRY